MNDRVRVGVIGAGSMGASHARVYSMLRTADLVAVADPDPAARQRVADLYGIAAYADHQELAPLIEAVSLAAPTSLHVPLAIDLLRRGVHVLVEKPIAPEVAGAEALLEEAARRELVLQVGHVERFNPAVQEAMAIVSDERVLAITARRLSPPTPYIPGDVVLDLLIHDLDIAMTIAASPVRTVGALGATDADRALHLVMAHVGFENGILADLIASKVTQQRIRELDVTTDRSLVTVNYRTRDISVFRNAKVDPVGAVGAARYRQEAVIERPIVATAEPLYAELEHFLACVRGATPRMHPRESVDALRLALRIRDLAMASALRTEIPA